MKDFYTRRLRRILPASLFLLAALTVFTVVEVQQTSWVGFFRELRASALFYEKWSLASGSTDYLAAGNSNPVQHFWSLSVEEQFYVVWPLALLTIGVFVTAQRRRRSPTAFIALVLAASLAFSIYYRQSDPPKAYFDTGTRLWEFAVGGLKASLGLIGRLGPRCSALVGWVGLAVIAACSRLLTGDSQFPGYLALVPVLATAAVMLSADPTRRWWSPAWLYALPPVQYVGKISYSVYLWHFPLVVLVPLLRDEPLKPRVGFAVFIASIVLGDLSQRFIESPFRGSIPGATTPSRLRWRGSMSQTVPILVGLLAITVVVSSVEVHRLGGQQDRARVAYEQVSDHPPTCYGAEVLAGITPGCTPATAQIHAIVPAPIIASTGFESQCLQGATRASILLCSAGRPPGSKRVAVVGDSHATAYLPAIQDIAITRGWRIDTYLKAGCMLTSDGPDEPCRAWNRNVLSALVAKHYDLVIVSGRAQYGPSASRSSVVKAAEAVARSWRIVQESGSVLVALRDSPQPVNAGRGKIPDCIDQHPTEGACDLARGPAERFEVMSAAASIDTSAHLIDLEDAFCTATTCPAVVGGVLVYVDDNHITATYARSLTGLISKDLAALGL